MTRILLVEDEDALRVGIARTLRERGHEVDEAGDGEDGLERLRHGAYGLVICDLALPGLDGLAMLKAAGDALGEARVLLMSGYDIKDAPPELAGRRHLALKKPIAHSAVADEAGALLAA